MPPQRNIELKARHSDLAAAQRVAEQIATRRLGVERQLDTYFHAPQGRLKLRQSDVRAAELVAYDRPNEAQARGSDYHLVPVANPETLKQALAMVLGVRVVVDKRREVFLYHNVRIHLDEVEQLGSFLEFEAVLGKEIDDRAGQEQLAELSRLFFIQSDMIVPESYSDLLERQLTSDG